MTNNYQKYWKHHKESYHYQNKKKVYEFKPASKTTTLFNTLDNGTNQQIANRGIWFSVVQLLLIAFGSYAANRIFNTHPHNVWSNLGYYLSLFNYFWVLILFFENIGEYYHINGQHLVNIPIQKFIKLANTVMFILLINFILIIIAINVLL